MPKKPSEQKDKKKLEKTEETSENESEYETEDEEDDEELVPVVPENNENDDEDDDECPYMPMGKRQGANKIAARIDKDDEDYEDDDDNYTGANIFVLPEDRITSNLMTKYERVRLLSTRTVQLEGGAKPMIKNTENLNAKQIARLELQHKKIPIKIIRPLPNGKKEMWSVSELIIKK